ncbi:MAG: DUF805 domain-containing protein [Pseudomonadota bacterium]
MTPQAAWTFLTSTQGRISRRGLALGVLLPLFISLAIVDALNNAAVTALFWLLAAWPLFVATPWKRLQDMDRTGRWNLVFLPFYALGFGFFLGEYVLAEGGWAKLFDGQAPETIQTDLTASGLGGFSTILIFLPIHLFWLYLIPGVKGDNSYGSPPRA